MGSTFDKRARSIATEPIGNIPRPLELIEAVMEYGSETHPAVAPVHTAFEKVRARVLGTALATQQLLGRAQ